MIVVRTPLRISLVGGGTDLPEFYRHNNGGAVVSFTIDKYVYIAVNRPFENKVRVSYSETENVLFAEDVQHELVRNCLKKMNITQNIEIVSISDIPGRGTGLGSSSAFTVGLLNALVQFGIKYRPPGHKCYDHLNVAEESCDVEIRMCGKPIGKQDQYASAYGGLNYFEFKPDDSVDIHRITMKKEHTEELNKRLMLFWTGITRRADTVLDEQNENIEKEDNTRLLMEKMKYLAHDMYIALSQGNISIVGDYLHKNWMFKKQLASNITNDKINAWYEMARIKGAVGGKVLGAGGGGFMLFYVPKDKQDAVRDELPLKQVPFKISNMGTEVIYE